MIHSHFTPRAAVTIFLAAIIFLAGAATITQAADSKSPSETNFQTPPQVAQPWVYWFWLNSNITREGITADLEAMHRAGVGGVLIMEVDQGAPVGPVAFASPQWLELFKHACSEAKRLGIEINMNNDAGWNGSGGPWIKPEQSMQKIVWTEKQVEGPKKFVEKLPQPQALANYYEDITVMAFPTPEGNARISGLSDKAAYTCGNPAILMPAAWATTPAAEIISPEKIVTLTGKMAKDGQLTWDVPEGKWTILRFGHTTTGKENHPTPASGCGLECDKMSKEAAETHWAGLMGKIIKEVGPLAGKTLVATHIDSWENGSQNWTPKFREEFKNRRGYDLMPFFPVMTGRIVGNRELSERFLWDIRKTVSELVLENYAGHFRDMAHRNGMKLSIEAYTWCPIDELAYAGVADEPIGEFWSWWFGTNKKYGFSFSCTEMTSAAHIYGKKIIGAEAFTACDSERWQGHPRNIKDLGDWAFCEGINRFIFHRYAMQPWLTVKPGMGMGPWGLHYERTQTWWEMSKAWHEYLARCQYLLREGLFVADVCYLGGDLAPQSIVGQKRFLAKTPDVLDPNNPDYPRDRLDYSFDVASTDALLTRMAVKDGRIVLPDGMSYRLLVLPNTETMTPKVIAKIRDLVEAGATVVGSRPSKSPSLSDYPQCDSQVQQLAEQIWGSGQAPTQLTKREVGKGHVYWSSAFQKVTDITKNPQEQLGEAKWIWYPEGNPAASVPPGNRYFQKTFTVEGDVKSAELVMTADNEFTVWLGGQQAGAGDTHTRAFSFDVAPLLKQGANLIAVEAVNTTDAPTPAGLIGKLTIQYKDGHKQTFATDATWKTTNAAKDNWNSQATVGNDWASAKDLGTLGMAPWGTLEAAAPNNELYPEVDLITDVLKKMDVQPDFTYQTKSWAKSLRYIHRNVDGADIYFVANKLPQTEQAVCSFRVQGKQPEFWYPDSGKIERPAVYDEADGTVRVPITFDPVGSVFVIFRDKAVPASQRIATVSRDGKEIISTTLPAGATTPSADKESTSAAPVALPTFASGVTVNIPPQPVEDPGVKITLDSANQLQIQATKPGRYTLVSADKASRKEVIVQSPEPLKLTGEWDVHFNPADGGPESIKFDKLISWSDHPNDGVKYYSGTAAYTKTFTFPAGQISKDRRYLLDLGQVEVMAEVTLNGKNLGILWKTPYSVDVSSAIKAGENKLEVKVVNLWINRQIGDELLPEDSDRNADGTLKSWPKWVLEGKASPTGRKTFASWRLWHKDEPLSPSGLIGPVQIVPSAMVELPAATTSAK